MGRPTKLSAAQWLEIGIRKDAREPLSVLSAEFGVARSTIIGHFRLLEARRLELNDRRGRVKLPVKVDALSRNAGFVYVIFLDAPGERFYKIGRATDFDSRVNQHRTSSPYQVCIAIGYFSEDAVVEEAQLHALFESQCIRGEWFRLSREDLKTIAARALRC